MWSQPADYEDEDEGQGQRIVPHIPCEQLIKSSSTPQGSSFNFPGLYLDFDIEFNIDLGFVHDASLTAMGGGSIYCISLLPFNLTFDNN